MRGSRDRTEQGYRRSETDRKRLIHTGARDPLIKNQERMSTEPRMSSILNTVGEERLRAREAGEGVLEAVNGRDITPETRA